MCVLSHGVACTGVLLMLLPIALDQNPTAVQSNTGNAGTIEKPQVIDIETTKRLVRGS
jgi:hypothetical protein